MTFQRGVDGRPVRAMENLLLTRRNASIAVPTPVVRAASQCYGIFDPVSDPDLSS